MLPYDVLERIASFADVDARRSMGFAPRKLEASVLERAESLVRRKLEREYACNGCVYTFRQMTSSGTIAYLNYDASIDAMTVMFMKNYDACILKDGRVLIVRMPNHVSAPNQYRIENAFDGVPKKSISYRCVGISAPLPIALARDFSH